MSVIAFIENKKDFSQADKEKRDILKLYREDIMKMDVLGIMNIESPKRQCLSPKSLVYLGERRGILGENE